MGRPKVVITGSPQRLAAPSAPPMLQQPQMNVPMLGQPPVGGGGMMQSGQRPPDVFGQMLANKTLGG